MGVINQEAELSSHVQSFSWGFITEAWFSEPFGHVTELNIQPFFLTRRRSG